MVSLTFTIFIAVHLTVSGSFSKPRALPEGLAVFLEKMGIPMEDFFKSYRAHRARVSNDNTRSQATKEDLTTRLSVSTISDETTRYHVSSDVPEHSGGVVTNVLNNIPYIPGGAHCAARPTTIEIPKTYGVSIYPSYVILHRCSGACSLQGKQHCAVTKQDAIDVLIVEYLPNNVTFAAMRIYNHTGCDCDCIQTASDCDPHRETWNAGLCKCECVADGSQCDSNTQNWDGKTCRCECSTAPQVCDDHNKVWDTENCGCHCKQSLQDQCTAQNQSMDTATCKCVDNVNAV